MTLKTFYYFFDESLKAENQEQAQFVAKYLNDELWQVEEVTDLTKKQIALFKIWDAAHIKVKKIKKKLKITEQGFADMFHVPRSTVSDWCQEQTQCSVYFKIAVLGLSGLLDVEGLDK